MCLLAFFFFFNFGQQISAIAILLSNFKPGTHRVYSILPDLLLFFQQIEEVEMKDR